MESIWIELYNRTTAPDGTERVSEPPRRIRKSYKSEDLELVLSRTAKVLLLWSDLRRSWL